MGERRDRPGAYASSTPLHRQIMDSFHANIQSGEWPPGYRVPPETQLAKLFGVSRTTIRQAIAPLVAKGLLRRFRGQGTFVADPKYEPDVSGLWDLAEGIWGSVPPVHRTLGVSVLKAPPGVARLLEVSARTPVVEVVRLRFLNDEPIALERFHVLHEMAPGLAEDDLSGLLLYPVLVRRYGMDLHDVTTWLEPTVLTASEATYLGVTKNTPALLIRRILRNSRRQPVVSTTIIIRGDKCRYVMRESFRMTPSLL